jgi:hypothetical protein
MTKTIIFIKKERPEGFLEDGMAEKKGRGVIPGWQDGLGRGLLILSALSAVGAFAVGLSATMGAASDRLWVETWRTLGFLVFAGLFAVLAWRPRLSAGVWELVILNKAALAGIGFVYGTAETLAAAPIDGALAAVLVVSYLLTRGWRSWRKQTAA